MIAAMSERSDDVSPDGRDESANERADRNWNEILQELRVTQTGTQLISGFLLAVAFQSRFEDLDAYQLGLYLTLVALAAAATFLGLVPVVLHRSRFRRHQKVDVVRIANRYLIANTVVVSLLVAGVCSLIFDFTLSRVAGFVALGLGVGAGVALWAVTRPGPVASATGVDRLS